MNINNLNVINFGPAKMQNKVPYINTEVWNSGFPQIPQTALSCRGSGGVGREPVVVDGHRGAECAL